MGQTLLGLEVPGVSFEVVLHLATLVSVLIVYRERLASLISGALQGDRGSVGYVGLLALASVPAAIPGVAFQGFLESLFDKPWITGGALIATGVILWTAKPALRREPSRAPNAVDALLMGVAQAFAIVPGISRSGSTVVTALWRKVDPEEAAAFSFLMSIPAIGGAALLKLPEMSSTALGLSPWALSLSALVACVSGVLAIRTFVAMLKQRSFHRFAPYLWVVGTLFLIFVL